MSDQLTLFERLARVRARTEIGLTVDDVRAAIAAGDPLIVGYGAGVNSVAALILLARRYRLRPALISLANTMGEKEETYAHKASMGTWLASVGFPQITDVVKESPRTGDLSLEAECLRRETLPSRAFGMSSCAMRWKIEPQEKYLNHWQPARDCWARGRKPVKVLGYDGGEQRRASVHEDAKLRYWYPLMEADVDRAECIRMIEAEGLAVPIKSACFFCPSSTKAEVLWLAEKHPDLFARAVTMEETALGNTRYPLRDVKGLGRHWAWRDLVNMTTAERAQQLEQPVESCTVCVEEDRNAP